MIPLTSHSQCFFISLFCNRLSIQCTLTHFSLGIHCGSNLILFTLCKLTLCFLISGFRPGSQGFHLLLSSCGMPSVVFYISLFQIFRVFRVIFCSLLTLFC